MNRICIEKASNKLIEFQTGVEYEYFTIQVEIEEPVIDEEGNLVLDEEENPVLEIKIVDILQKKEKLGTLTANAVIAGYKKKDIEEKYIEDDLQTVLLKYETAEEKQVREEKEKKRTNYKKAKKSIADKYEGKSLLDITPDDLDLWRRLNMGEELGLEL